MERISVLQVAYLLFVARGVIVLSVLPIVGTAVAGRDAWLAGLLGTGLALVPTWLALRVAALDPEKDLIQICEACLGRVLGRVAGFLFLGFFAVNAAVVLRQFADLLTTAPMPETPTELFLGMMALTTAYAVRRGIEVTARVTELLLPPLTLFLLLVLLLGVKDMDPGRLKPFLERGWGPVGRGAAVAGALWGDVMLLAMLSPHVGQRRQLPRFVVGATLASGAWLVLTALAVIMFFSAPEAGAQVFHLFTLMRTVSLGDFVERLDPLFLIPWTFGSFIKLSLLSAISVRALARLLGLGNDRCLALPMGFLGAVVALQQFESVNDLRALNSPQVLPLLVFPFAVGLPVLLLVLGRLRGLGSGGA